MKLTESQAAVATRIREEAPGEILRLGPDLEGLRVVQQLSDNSQPVLYRVTLEEQIDGPESLHWADLGPVRDTNETPTER